MKFKEPYNSISEALGFNYDQEIEYMYHPENFQPAEEDQIHKGKISKEHLDRCAGCSLCTL